MSASEGGFGIGGMRALAHPLRLRLLSLLTGSAMSAAEAARALGTSQANVSYHLRQLHSAGLLELVEQTTVRGGRAKRYRHNPSSGEALSSESVDAYGALAGALSEELLRRTRERDTAAPGTFTDAELWLTPEAWERALQLARELGSVMHAAAQPPGTEGTVRASATVVLFGMGQEEGQP